MLEKNPLNWTWGMWLLPIGVGLFGGLVSVISKLARKEIVGVYSIEVFAEITASGFVSLVTFTILNSLEFDIGLCASIAGIVSHKAMRWLFKVDQIIDHKLDEIDNQIIDHKLADIDNQMIGK